MPTSPRTTTSTQHECEHCSFSFVPPESASADVVRCPRCWRPVSVSPPDEGFTIVFKSVDSDTASEIDVLTSDTTIQSNDALEQLVHSLEAEIQSPPDDVDITDEELAQLTAEELEALGFGHLAPAIPAREEEPAADEAAEEELAAESAIVFPEPEARPGSRTRSQPKQKPKQKQTDEEQEELSFVEEMKRNSTSYGVSFLFHLALLILAALIVFRTRDYNWHGEINGARESIGDGGGLELEAPVEFTAPLPAVDTRASNAVLTGNFGQGFGENAGKGGIGFFGTKAQGKSFAFVVDISGSMTNPLPMSPRQLRRNRREREQQQTISRWHKAREELMQAIDAMSENQSFAVMLYNDRHLAFTRDGEPVGLMRATKRNKDDVRMWLNSINAQGGTEPQLSIHEALKLEPEVLFFLTDGIIPPQTRETARQSNIGETVIHTTCIGSLENTILQLIANDSGGRFRSVSGSDFETGSQGVTLVCFASSEPSNQMKFKHIEEDLKRFRSESKNRRIALNDDSHSMLILHNAAADIPQFTLEVQRLLKELNSGTKAGFDTQIGSGRLGINVPLDDLNLRYTDDSIQTAGRQKMPVRRLLEKFVSEENMKGSQAVKAIYVFGDLDAKREILAGLEVYNLYNGSVIRIVDGEKFVKKQR